MIPILTDTVEGPNHRRKFLPGDSHQRSSRSVGKYVVHHCFHLSSNLHPLVDAISYLQIHLRPLYPLWLLRACLSTAWRRGVFPRRGQRVDPECGDWDLCHGVFERSFLFRLEFWERGYVISPIEIVTGH